MKKRNNAVRPVFSSPPASPMQPLTEWFNTVRFPRAVLGGVDEAEMWKRLEELHALYEAALTAERVRCGALPRREEAIHER